MYFAKRLDDGHWVALCTDDSFVVDELIGLHYEDHTLENWMDVVLFCNQKNKELNKNTDL